MIQDYETRLRELAQAKALIDSEEKEIKEKIKAEHTSTTTATYGGIQVQVIGGYFTLDFDLDTFKAEHEDLVAKYQKVVYKPVSTKIVLVKPKGDK